MRAQEGLAATWSWFLTHPSIYPFIPQALWGCVQAGLGGFGEGDTPEQSGSCRQPWVNQSTALGILQRR